MDNSRLDRLALISKIWPWLFLCALLVFFEVWARISDHRSFIFNAYNLQSIGLAASAPLLLAIGQTFVIITAGIDLSVGFVMGLAAVCIAIPLGVLSASFRDGMFDHLVLAYSMLGAAMPNFWLGLILIELIALKAHLLPSSGFVPLGQDPGAWLRSLILPVITLAAIGVTGIAKQTRDAMSEVLGREFMTALRMAGLPRRSLLLRHALRNAAIPVVTAAGLFAIAMLGGTILVEQVFVLPGMGSLVVQAASDHDLPVIEGAVLYFTVIVIVVNLLIDLSYAWLNPKVRVTA